MTHFESHGVEDQTTDNWHATKSCLREGGAPGDVKDHHMISVKTGSEMVPFVEQCTDCSWIDPRALEQAGHQIVKRSLSERAARIAVATETEPFAFVQSVHEELEISEVLGQALGAASTCWEERALFGAGTFDSARAGAILIALTAEVERFRRLALQDAATRAVEALRNAKSDDWDLISDLIRKAIEEE